MQAVSLAADLGFASHVSSSREISCYYSWQIVKIVLCGVASLGGVTQF